MTGTIYGIGLGPGDPDLMSVRAHRLLTSAKHVAFFRKEGRAGRSRTLAGDLVPEGAVEFPMEYPVTTEIPLTDPRYNEILSGFYADACAHLADLARAGHDVMVLCEGDPFFYGSFMHVFERLKDVVPVEVVPAITGMSAAWTATGQPITWG
ncbi:MAG: SAM-dependent methyltransferase, partial [Silicimonas sp.]|nr:SAM-dependent methyltransferase [Silicimonas sp.]